MLRSVVFIESDDAGIETSLVAFLSVMRLVGEGVVGLVGV